MKMVIADDEQYIRDALSEIDWQKSGITLAGAASDGREAVELCVQLRPDVLLTDIRMPYLNGIEVMKRLKSELPGLKFVLLSGWNDFEYAREAIRLGASDYLVKPCPDEEIVDAVRIALGAGRTESDRRKSGNTGSREDVPGTESKRHVIKMACDMIHRDLSVAITLTEIAEKVNMNPSAFSRLFRQEMGASFSQYVTSARMNRAKKLLMETNMKIQDVAQSIGYVGVSHFVQVFGEYTGMTPGTFRELNG